MALPVELLHWPQVSATPSFAQVKAGNLLVAFVATDEATPTLCQTAGWLRAATAVEDGIRAEVWYEANCRAGEPFPVFTGKDYGMLAEFTQHSECPIMLVQATSF